MLASRNHGSIILVCVFMLITGVFHSVPRSAFAGTNEELLQKGIEAYKNNELQKAEGIFTEALSVEPDNYRIMFGLAKAKAGLGKYAEAKELTDKVLAMNASNGRDVLVFYKGETEGEEAELVDESVLPPQRTKDNMRNYLDVKGNAPIPHYRLFFKKTRKMELVPQSVVTLKHVGVLRRVYEDVHKLNVYVKKRMVAAEGGSTEVEMVALKGGCFNMGSKEGTPAEQPVHEVCLNPFKMDKYEVTQAAFQAVMGTNPSDRVGNNLPVESVTWYEADTYCKKLGKRLPTEAEYEYAMRAGTDSHFYWGTTVKEAAANFCDKNCTLNIRVASIDDGFPTTAPVGQYKPNGYGLHDIAGNVAEWVSDWMNESYYRVSPKDNPKGSHATTARVARGGGWNTTAGYLRSSNRMGYWVNFRNPAVGFRCVKDS